MRRKARFAIGSDSDINLRTSQNYGAKSQQMDKPSKKEVAPLNLTPEEQIKQAHAVLDELRQKKAARLKRKKVRQTKKEARKKLRALDDNLAKGSISIEQYNKEAMPLLNLLKNNLISKIS